MRAFVLVAAAGCFHPDPPALQGCGPDDWCPAPLACAIDHVCHARGAIVDPCGTRPSDEITFEGHLVGADTNAPLAGLDVTLTPGGMTTTDANGLFQVPPVPVTDSALIESFASTGQGTYPPHRVFYQRPFTQSVSDLGTKELSNAMIAGLYPAFITQDPSKTTVLVALRDCNGTGIAGASFMTTPAAAGIVYQGGNPSQTDTTGVAYALNAPVGPLTIQTGDTIFEIDVRAGELAIANLLRNP